MRGLTFCPVLWLAMCAGPTTSAAGFDAEPSSQGVRRPAIPADTEAAVLLERATERSPTIRALLTDLAATDVVVKIVTGSPGPGSLARLRFLGTSPGGRWLEIRINARCHPELRIEWLGHELQHAREIGQAPAVRTAEDLRTLYRRLGWTSTAAPTGGEAYETRAAIRVQQTVRKELAAWGRQARAGTGT